MPIVTFHLVAGLTSAEQDERLLRGASRLYSEILATPVERVRAFIARHAPDAVAVGGDLVIYSGRHAPWFEFIVLEGRPVAERQRLLMAFTDLIVETLGTPRELVRGSCRRVDPEDWAIGGVPASLVRKAEVEARAAAGTTGHEE